MARRNLICGVFASVLVAAISCSWLSWDDYGAMVGVQFLWTDHPDRPCHGIKRDWDGRWTYWHRFPTGANGCRVYAIETIWK